MTDEGVDPIDFLRHALAISPDDAADVRADAAAPKTVDVQLVHDDVVLRAWTEAVWREPADSYKVNGREYAVVGYTEHAQPNGRKVYEVTVRPA